MKCREQLGKLLSMNSKSRFLSIVAAALVAVSISGCGGSESQDATITQVVKEAAPTISVQPKNVEQELGDSAVFIVEAAGQNLKYQWKKDGVPVEGATASTYTIPALSVGDAKSIVTVAVSNSAGTVESVGASVLVNKTMPAQVVDAYLTARQVSISELLPNESVGKLDVSVLDGPDMMIKLGKDNVLRYLSPVEQYKETETTLALQDVDTGIRYLVSFPWSSRVGEPIGPERGGSDASLTLNTDGDARAGHINDKVTSAVYTLKSKNRIDMDFSQITMSGQSDPILVTDWFDVNAQAGTLALKKDRIQQFHQIIKESGTASLHFSLATTDRGVTYSFDSELRYAPAALAVKMVNSEGRPDLTTVGKHYVVTGYQSGFSELLTVNEFGELRTKNIPVDNYSVSEVLLDPGVPAMSSAHFDEEAKEGVLTFVTSQSQSGNAVNSFKDDVESGTPSGQDRPNSELQPEPEPEAPSDKSRADSSYYTWVSSSTAEKEIVRPFKYTIGPSVTEVAVEVVVTSSEALRYKDVKDPTPRDDRWRFFVEIPGMNPAAEFGTVLNTHGSSTRRVFNYCFELPVDKRGYITITGVLAAANAVNNTYPTKVEMTLKTYCSLTITEFSGQSTSVVGTGSQTQKTKMITPANTRGNIVGQYLSLPIKKQLPRNFGIPSEMEFLPREAIPKEVELFIKSKNGQVSLGKQYLNTEGVVITPGRIKIPSLTLGTASHEPSPDKVELLAQLTAEVNGEMQTSKPSPIVIDRNYSVFTPLYLADSMSGYAQSGRYGTHGEPGGDSWGTHAMLDWLIKTPYRYNDLSAANIGQDADNKFRSVLDHAGHSDGQQVDVRYADGEGGFTDALGGGGEGRAILDLAQAAKNEVDTKANPSPNVDKLTVWIQNNRSIINAEAASVQTRAIFIGDSFIHDLLISGVFPGSKIPVPGVGKWTDRSAKISVEFGHLDHWHISRK